MNSIRRFLAETDIRDLMFFVMMLTMSAIGGCAGVVLGLWLMGKCS